MGQPIRKVVVATALAMTGIGVAFPAAPVVTSITTGYSTTGAPTSITITGTGLATTTTATLGGTALTPTTRTSTTFTGTVPSTKALGDYVLSVINSPGGASNTACMTLRWRPSRPPGPPDPPDRQVRQDPWGRWGCPGRLDRREQRAQPARRGWLEQLDPLGRPGQRAPQGLALWRAGTTLGVELAPFLPTHSPAPHAQGGRTRPSATKRCGTTARPPTTLGSEHRRWSRMRRAGETSRSEIMRFSRMWAGRAT